MKIGCHCGETIYDTSDDLACKAHFIADQNWDELLDAIDDAIEKSGPSAKEKDAACMQIRYLILKLKRSAWQCSSCGRVYLDDQEFVLRQFVPATGDEPQEIFRRYPNH